MDYLMCIVILHMLCGLVFSVFGIQQAMPRNVGDLFGWGKNIFFLFGT